MINENELYYIQVPVEMQPVSHQIEFLAIDEFLGREHVCRALWDLISERFTSRWKFLTIWPHVRYVAICQYEQDVAGLLLVSTALNWQIDYVTVRPDYQGQGIASALVNETVNQALRRKVPYLMLTSRESLRPLYEGRCGFEAVACREAPPKLLQPIRQGECAD
jgi:ribosomal protein S18 acetylase RimI-like enzyme